MLKVTDILSKCVLSISDAKAMGVIANAYMSEKLKRLRGWLVVQDESDEEPLLPRDRIIGNGDAVTVMHPAVLRQPKGEPCPFGAKVYDSLGKYIGIFRDLLFEEKSGFTTSLVVEEALLPAELVLSASADGVILRAEAHASLRTHKAPRKGKNRKAKDYLPTFSLSETDLPESSIPEEVISEEQAPSSLADAPLPSERKESKLYKSKESVFSLYGDYAFLLGRKVHKDLYAQGELLAEKGRYVDEALLEQARCKGKLVELTVNSGKE
ncbi:MAG: hypothetical protein J6Y74_00425 [Clostridia bacterium]|nr:hypothetical protein [Clostridia bacterium]